MHGYSKRYGDIEHVFRIHRDTGGGRLRKKIDGADAEEIDFDAMFYLYTVKMKLSEESFFSSSIGKVIYLIEQWGKEQQMKADALNGIKPSTVQSARSFKSILGGM